MKRYSEYKDSGVKWIGEIPGHWKICRTRYLCNINTGDKDTVMKEDNGKYPFYVRSPKIERINTFSYDGEAILMAGDGVGAGKVFHYANGKFDYHQRVYNMHNICGVSGKFMFYFIRDQFHYAMEEKNAKSTVDSVRLPWLKAFPIAIPAQEEQEAIVTYLDTKVAKIDEYISIAEKKIAALEELKQTIITEAVTRGIHKDVPMKDSGVKWIGMIPEHWTVCKMRKSIYEINIKNNPIKTTQILSLTNKQGVIPYEDKGNQGNKAKEDISSYKIAFKDNIIMNSMNVIIGSVGLSNYEGCVSPVYYVYGIREGTDKHFINYICQLSFFQKELRRFAKGILEIRLRVSSKDIQNTYIALPSLSEQQEIVTYIEAKVASINQLCQAERAQIEKLKEYKQRLISDVVTGKVKVTND